VRLRDALERKAPDVTVVFRPEVIPAGLLDDLPGLMLGMLTEPLPRDRAACATRTSSAGCGSSGRWIPRASTAS
jgi:hypothetical protein